MSKLQLTTEWARLGYCNKFIIDWTLWIFQSEWTNRTSCRQVTLDKGTCLQNFISISFLILSHSKCKLPSTIYVPSYWIPWIIVICNIPFWFCFCSMIPQLWSSFWDSLLPKYEYIMWLWISECIPVLANRLQFSLNLLNSVVIENTSKVCCLYSRANSQWSCFSSFDFFAKWLGVIYY